MTSLLFLIVLAGPGSPPAVSELVRQVLADPSFRFCHDPHYPLTADEERLCHVGVPGPACPALIEACRAGASAREQGRAPRRSFHLPDSPAFRRGALALLILVLAFLGRSLLSSLGSFRPRVPAPADLPPGAAAVVSPLPTESDAERLLARAHAAAAAGDHARAVADLHGALLRRLDASGVIDFHPSRTNGEYLRAAARARPALAPALGDFVSEVEAVEFGATAATPELFQSLLGRLRLIAGAAAVLLMVGLAGCDFRSDWDRSPSGRAAVIALLARVGKQARERITPVSRLSAGATDGVVLLPGAQLSAADWITLSSWTRQGGLLVVAGVPGDPPDWLNASSVGPLVDGPVRSAPGTAPRPLTLELPPSPTLDLKPGFNTRLLRNDLPYAAIRPYGVGSLLVVADDRLFTNGALPFGDDALALIQLLGGAARIDLVGELTGAVSPDPVSSVARAHLLPFLGQLGLVLAAFFVMRGTPLGRLREPPPPARRSFGEHVEALAQQYARAGAAAHLRGPYARLVAERLRQRMTLPAGTGLPALAEAVAARTGRPTAEVLALLADSPRTDPGPALASLRGLATTMDEIDRRDGGPGERRGLS